MVPWGGLPKFGHLSKVVTLLVLSLGPYSPFVRGDHEPIKMRSQLESHQKMLFESLPETGIPLAKFPRL